MPDPQPDPRRLPTNLAALMLVVAERQAALGQLHSRMIGTLLQSTASFPMLQATQRLMTATLPTRLLTEQVATLMNSYRTISSTFGPMFERWREQHERAHVILAPRGWLLSPSFPVGLASRVVALYEEKGIEEVEKSLLEAMTHERCRELLNETLEHSEFAKWAKTLQKAMNAHAAGDCELAIPIWIMSIEGIWRATLLAQTSPFKERLSKAERKKLMAALSIEGGIYFTAFEALLVVVALMGGDVQDENLGGVLKRNGVLHGQFPEVGTEKDSVQLILVLNLMWHLLGESG